MRFVEEFPMLTLLVPEFVPLAMLTVAFPDPLPFPMLVTELPDDEIDPRYVYGVPDEDDAPMLMVAPAPIVEQPAYVNIATIYR